ncbi:hypothetical protein ASZ90_019646 [hydrocarbon metagenome]|uniref:Uncharacterized protein n=1 Tax=hydrocarbon metagenome TaxID=938273 RepID=A0A0W8E3M9_9ZZZZ
MNKNKVNRKQRSKAWKIAAIWITLTISLGMVGPGMALWDMSLPDSGLTVNIGSIDPVLTGLEIKSGAAGSVNYSEDSADFELEGVEPGSQVAFSYTLENRGSIPVTAQVEAGASLPEEVTLLDSPPLLVDGEDSANGEFTLLVNGDWDESYLTDLKLVYRQWNAFHEADDPWRLFAGDQD